MSQTDVHTSISISITVFGSAHSSIHPDRMFMEAPTRPCEEEEKEPEEPVNTSSIRQGREELLQDQKVYCLLLSTLWLAVDGCCGRIITSSHLQLPVGPNIWEL